MKGERFHNKGLDPDRSPHKVLRGGKIDGYPQWLDANHLQRFKFGDFVPDNYGFMQVGDEVAVFAQHPSSSEEFRGIVLKGDKFVTAVTEKDMSYEEFIASIGKGNYTNENTVATSESVNTPKAEKGYKGVDVTQHFLDPELNWTRYLKKHFAQEPLLTLRFEINSLKDVGLGRQARSFVDAANIPPNQKRKVTIICSEDLRNHRELANVFQDRDITWEKA